MTSNQTPSGLDDHPGGDDWLDTLLAADRKGAPHVDDGGFTARVLDRLPASSVRRRERWIVPAMGALGVLIGLGVLSGATSLSFGLVELLSPDAWSFQKLFIVALPLGLLYGIAFEAALRER